MANPNAKGNPNWVKGISGNPTGRKPTDPAIRAEIDRIFAAASVDAAQSLVAFARNPKQKDLCLKACIHILDRVLGKPQQQVELASSGNFAVNVTYPTKAV